jgi:2-succinyl-6-hydroxy-2,4-cyclohexadiene-1-carboxylate synthase
VSTRVLLVPGFTQTAASWDAVVGALAPDVAARALDVPDGLDFVATAAALAAEGGPGAWVGYSMGGRLALRLALDHPEVVDALVLVSTAPGLQHAADRAARRDSDEGLARQVEHNGVDAFVDRWLAQPMFATVPSDASGLAERRRLTTARITHQLRALGTGTMEPLWHRLAELAMPVTIVTGILDTKYDAIGDEMAAHIVGVTRVRVDCGHAVLLEAPSALAAAIEHAAVATG